MYVVRTYYLYLRAAASGYMWFEAMDLASRIIDFARLQGNGGAVAALTAESFSLGIKDCRESGIIS